MGIYIGDNNKISNFNNSSMPQKEKKQQNFGKNIHFYFHLLLDC